MERPRTSSKTLEIPPQPPLFETYLCHIDQARWAPRARFRSPKRRPTTRIDSPICRGAPGAIGQESYGV